MANELQALNSLFQNRLFRIPDYQRGYAWQQPQLVNFWEDLNNLQMDRYHYTGLLSLKLLEGKETVNWGNDLWMVDKGFKPCHIVDGQQRLTTFIILLNEIINFACSLEENKEKSDEDIVLGNETIREIKAKYICQKRPPQNIITTYMFGYETDNPSDKYLRYKVFNEPNSGEINDTYYTKNLKTAKEFFVNNIEALYGEEGIEGLIRMYKKLTQKMMFNLHEIDDDYDVFVAFETMNNRGKKLTNLELLKNRLIYLTTIYNNDKLDEKDKSELRKQVNEAWKEVYYQLGRNKTTPLSDDDFLRAHWIIYYVYTRKKGDDYISFLLNKFSAKNVFEKKTVVDIVEQTSIYEEAIDDTNYDDEPLETEGEETSEVLLKLEPCEIADYVDSLKDLAKYWYDTFFPTESTILSDKEKLWIDRLNRIGIGYFRPLVTVALSKCTVEEEKVALFTAIERFIFVCFRLANYRANYQSTVYYAAARELYSGKIKAPKITKNLNDFTDENIQYAISNFMTHIEKKFASGMKEGYYSWSSLKYFLYEYEYSLWKSTGVKKPSWELFSKSEKDKVSIEHILPQAPSKWYWKNQFRQFIQNESEMVALTGSLGNLLPLAQSINSSFQNDSFDEKKNPTNSNRRGYSSGSNSEIEVAKEDAWDGCRIYNRCLHLLSFMERRWSIQMTQEQKEKLTFVSFVNDGRIIPEELPKTEVLDSTQSVNRSMHLAKVFMMWASVKDADGEIILDRENSTQKFTRFTTDVMSKVYPRADEANSGWNTKNFYFYEIVNDAGRKIQMKFALSGKNLPDNLREISDRIAQYFPTRGGKTGWEFRCPFIIPCTDIPADMSDEEIYSILDDQYDQLMRFESKLVSILQGENHDSSGE
ncbi:MAG: DUF262 domain-containing protein [Ruminococcaceae bacterium]|nr:DUF262 domain-containing protein [Oscillospiraceae bacterium]